MWEDTVYSICGGQLDPAAMVASLPSTHIITLCTKHESHRPMQRAHVYNFQCWNVFHKDSLSFLILNAYINMWTFKIPEMSSFFFLIITFLKFYSKCSQLPLWFSSFLCVHENRGLISNKLKLVQMRRKKNHRRNVNEVVYWFTNRWNKRDIAKTSHWDKC